MKKKILLLFSVVLLGLGLCLHVSAEDEMPGPKSIENPEITKQVIFKS